MTSSHRRPFPVEVRVLLMLCLDRRQREFAMGDLEELWHERARTRGWLWRQAVALLWAHHRRLRPTDSAPQTHVGDSRDSHRKNQHCTAQYSLGLVVA